MSAGPFGIEGAAASSRRPHCSPFVIILGEGTLGAMSCLSPAQRDEFSWRTDRALEASKQGCTEPKGMAPGAQDALFPPRAPAWGIQGAFA